MASTAARKCGCLNSKPMPNRLLHTTSPYLLQHAHQPVDWYPWGEEALQKAQREDKPLLVSIGYAACHWCHVMAREAFSDPEAAAIMNEHFICIKVDREERPDIDQVYVAALQAMGLQAGWPLHVFLMPDQKPFYGGNYFSPAAWKQVLWQVAQAFQDHREQLTASATQFTQALNEEVIEPNEEDFTVIQPQQIFEKLYQTLDQEYGGLKGAPKFPMPSVGLFLLQYYRTTQDQKAVAQLELTLNCMAYGGIYDQLGGGFARYTTDEVWRIPHFEKMLYDNGQLLSLYAQAYTVTQKSLYKKVVRETVEFVTRELMQDDGGFYSALDADSEGVEGKFYTWTQSEIEEVLGDKAPFFIQQFNVTPSGNWKEGANILYQQSDSAPKATNEKLEQARQILLAAREQRKRPAQDKKVITSWNAIMIQGLLDAYNALGEARYLTPALRNAQFIEQYLQQGIQLYHSYSQGQLGAHGYLEDYAWVAKAWISLYQATFEEHWLFAAEALTQYALEHFYDDEAGLFHFVEKSEARLIARPKGLFDEVIPSANSVMAHNLWDLGVLMNKETYTNISVQMLRKISPRFLHHTAYLTNWATLSIRQLQPPVVVAIVGPECRAWAHTLRQHLPGKAWWIGTETTSDLSWLAHKKAINSKTVIYICYQGTCQAPIHSLDEATAVLESQQYQ